MGVNPLVRTFAAKLLEILYLFTYTTNSVTLIAVALLSLVNFCDAIEVIWAVNAGGSHHMDENGIQYSEDPLKVGIASDYGKGLSIQRVSRHDAILYQTERYHTNSFSYEVNLRKEGDFVLVMKFSEVYFTASRQKVFNVVLNDHHLIVRELDIFERVGLGRAHDEIIPFTIRNGKLVVINEASTFNDVLKITFVKTHYDNPKINAMYIMRGRVEDVPKLPPLFSESEDNRYNRKRNDFVDEDEKSEHKSRFNKRSGPIVEDPYASQDGNYFWPILCAIVVFIPTVICLCKM